MKINNLLLLLILASCWGPSFLFVKIAVEEISPFMLMTLRTGIGAALLLLYVIIKGDTPVLNSRLIKKYMIAGFFSMGLPYLLISWGAQYIDSTLTSLLNGITPIAAVVLSHFALSGERITLNKISGVMLGFLGLIILVFPWFMDGLTASVLGIVSVVLAAISYGVGAVYVKKNLSDSDPIQVSFFQLASVAVVSVLISFFMEPEFTFSTISNRSILSVIFLGSVVSAFGFVIYYQLLSQTNPVYVSTVTYLLPVYGLVLGNVFLSEPLHPSMFLGTIGIMMGISLVNKRSVLPKKIEQHLDTSSFSKFR